MVLPRNVPLPAFINAKKCCIQHSAPNIPNSLSFYNCLSYNLSIPRKVLDNTWLDKYKPMKLEKLGEFEKENGLSINVFGVLINGTVALHISQNYEISDKLHIDLLYVKRGSQFRYFRISDLSRLLGPQVAPRR